jgi:hypothetical protein
MAESVILAGIGAFGLKRGNKATLCGISVTEGNIAPLTQNKGSSR